MGLDAQLMQCSSCCTPMLAAHQTKVTVAEPRDLLQGKGCFSFACAKSLCQRLPSSTLSFHPAITDKEYEVSQPSRRLLF